MKIPKVGESQLRLERSSLGGKISYILKIVA